MLNEKESLENCKVERLSNQITLLRWVVIAFFILGAACVGLLFSHLWHDAQTFKSMRNTINETRETVQVLVDGMKKLHPPKEK